VIDAAVVRANLAAVRAEVDEAAAGAGRPPGAVEILAAVKYVTRDDLAALAEAGVTRVGENRSDALLEKREGYEDAFRWDFIGHLQSRKAKLVLPRVRLLHSLESESVLERIERLADAPVRVLLEVNVSGEESKYGVPADRVDEFVERASRSELVVLAGLMTMPPFAASPEDARPHFARLRGLAQRLRRDWAPRHEFSVLSMGTSQDFEVAVEEGATICRLGGVLYG